MEFCPKCESLLVPKKKKGKTVLECSSCGYKKKGKNVKITEKTKGVEKVEAVDKQTKTLPKTEAECPKCGHEEAYFRTEQTRAADESETLFFTCVMCGKTWREYE